jgi:hypothetical protein
METTPAPQLPDAEHVGRAAHLLVAAAPADWLRIKFVMWYVDIGVYGSREWVVSAGDPTLHRVLPPATDAILHAMRDGQITRSHEPWMRCDLSVSRSAVGATATLSIQFGYEVGTIPE